MTEVIRIDKIQAASRQIDTSIELLFNNKDQVSICMLLHSAWSVLKDLANFYSKGDTSRIWIADLHPRESQNIVWKKIDELWNFCKHAKNDPNKCYEFLEDYSEPALMLVIYDFSLISYTTPHMQLYQLWFVSKNKDAFEAYDYLREANEIFPKINEMSVRDQRSFGYRELQKVLQEN